jgi:hypothetical protein
MDIDIIKEIYRAFKAKDLSAVKQLQADNAEWSVAGPADKIPWAAPRYGPDGAAEFLKILGGLLVPEVFEIRDFFEKEGKVIATGYQKGYVLPARKPYEFDFIHLWELKDNKVTKFRVYYDTAYVSAILKSQ